MQVEVDEILEPRNADSRGRVRLGTEYADKEVRVAIVEVLDDTGQQDWPQPTACAECGGAVQEFTIVDGDCLCLDCAGIAPSDEPP